MCLAFIQQHMGKENPYCYDGSSLCILAAI